VRNLGKIKGIEKIKPFYIWYLKQNLLTLPTLYMTINNTTIITIITTGKYIGGK